MRLVIFLACMIMVVIDMLFCALGCDSRQHFPTEVSHYTAVYSPGLVCECLVLSRLPWQCLVVDEGHRLKNSSSVLYRQLKEVRDLLPIV